MLNKLNIYRIVVLFPATSLYYRLHEELRLPTFQASKSKPVEKIISSNIVKLFNEEL